MPARRNQRRVDDLLIIRAARDPGPEGEIAQNMLMERRAAREAARATASLPERLSELAVDIKSEWGKGIEAQFVVGHLLSDAKQVFEAEPYHGKPGDSWKNRYGAWIKAQNFPFAAKTAWRLKWAAENEESVRTFLAEREAPTGRDISIGFAVELMNAKPKPKPERLPPVDPAYGALRDARNRILGSEDEPTNAFMQMHVDDLAASAGIIRALATAYNEAKSSRE